MNIQSIISTLSLISWQTVVGFRGIGNAIFPGEFPYLVYLQHNDHKNDPYCLATLFRQDLILTTATCFERNPNVANISNYIRLPLDGNRHEKFFAISGQLTFLDNFPLGFNGQPWYLQSIHHSPQFDFVEGYGDFSYAKLNYPYGEADNIQTVSRRCGFDPPPGSYCIVLGWMEHPNGQKVLARISVQILDRQSCELMGRRIRDNSIICANLLEKRAAFTWIDTGGPLLCRNDQGDLVQAGINNVFFLGYAPDHTKNVYGFISVGYMLETDGDCNIPQDVPPAPDFNADEWNEYELPPLFEDEFDPDLFDNLTSGLE